MKKELVFEDKQREYELYKDERNRLYINVLCGGVGQFERTVMLTPENVEMYNEWGKSYLDDLAYRISRNPEKYPHSAI